MVEFKVAFFSPFMGYWWCKPWVWGYKYESGFGDPVPVKNGQFYKTRTWVLNVAFIRLSMKVEN